ncbi:MAG: hypothetical protein E7066_06180 [Lentimicrobiaceae bacterium]|nr:hypothetical protein [Lentimicrobiaceae bacterium]
MEKDIYKIIIDEDTYNFRDNSIPAWAKEPNKPSYSASDVGALPVGTNIPIIQYIANESSMPETPTEGILYLIGEEPLISFTINNTSYQAVEGMTWGEWVESEYNTSGLKIIDDYIWTESGSNTIVKDEHDSSSKVTANEMIESNFTYYQFASGGSSD